MSHAFDGYRPSQHFLGDPRLETGARAEGLDPTQIVQLVHVQFSYSSDGLSHELDLARFGAAEYRENCLKILIYSRVFWPSVGGMETMMEILAEEFTAAGHHVKVVTEVAVEKERGNQAYEVVRSPTLKSYVQLLRWPDVCLCAGVSLRGLVPIMVAGTPLVISHQATYNSYGRFNIVPELKKTVTRFSNNICCSKGVQSHIPGRSVVIPNTYRAEVFKEYSDVIRDLDIVFVGRLVSDKGISDLIGALGQLGQTGFRPRLSIVWVTAQNVRPF